MAKADITVNGRRYSIACAPGREERLTQLATQLDAQIKNIASAVGDIGEERLLLIASLALLDDLDMARRNSASPVDEQRAAAALAQAAQRIQAIAARIEEAT
ncbi:MAG: cell division protein ZapA [Pseudomonadota bacterium]